MYEINGPADESGKACAKTDWAKFLAAMCTLIGVEIDWGEIEDPSVSALLFNFRFLFEMFHLTGN